MAQRMLLFWTIRTNTFMSSDTTEFTFHQHRSLKLMFIITVLNCRCHVLLRQQNYVVTQIGGSKLEKYLPHRVEAFFILWNELFRIPSWQKSLSGVISHRVTTASTSRSRLNQRTPSFSATRETKNRSASEQGCTRGVPPFIYSQNYMPRELISWLNLYLPPPPVPWSNSH